MKSDSHHRSDANDRLEQVRALVADCVRRRGAGEELPDAELIEAHAELMPELGQELRKLRLVQQARAKAMEPPPDESSAVDPADDDFATQTHPGSDSTLTGASGQRVVRYFGDYEILGKVAEGGMGVVYKARQKSLKRLVALKLIRAGEFAGEQERDRFYAEAEAAANLAHPNIVSIFEVGQHGGRHFFSMAYVDGPSLGDVIRDRPLPSRQAGEYVRSVAATIQFAHEHGTLHRDIKPSNVLLDKESGQPLVTDFGLAKRVESDSDLTASGQVLGTPNYMPPEQAMGDHKRIDARSDVYSLGALLYALLTGRPPFQADSSVATLLQVIEQEPVPPRQLNRTVDRDLETICLKCLEKDPARRYQTAEALADDVGHYLRGEPIHARPVSRPERLVRWCKRNRALAAMTAAVFVVLVAGTIVSSSFAIFANKAKGEWKREAQRARTAEGEAERQKDEAQRQKQEAQRAAERAKIAESAAIASRQVAEQKSIEAQAAAQRERAAKLEAQATAQRERQARAEALQAGYFNSVALADAYLRQGEPDLAAGVLEQCPHAQRHWEYRYLSDRSQRGRRSILRDITASSACYSPDGRYIIAGTTDGQLVCWDDLRRRVVWQQAAHEQGIAGLAMNAEGNRLATASADGTARLWSFPEGELLHTLEGHEAGLTKGVAFSPDGKRLGTIAADKTARIWDCETGVQVSAIATDQPLRTLAWADDSQTVFVGQTRTRFLICDASTGEIIKPGPYLPAQFDSMVSTPDGSILAVCGNGWLRVWRVEGGELREMLFQRGSFHFTSMSISDDGERVVASTHSNRTFVYDVRRDRKLAEYNTSRQVAINAEGSHCLLFGRDALRFRPGVVIYPATARTSNWVSRTSKRDPHCSGFTPSGKWIVTDDGLYDAGTGARLTSGGGQLLSDGQRIASFHDGVLRITSLAGALQQEVRVQRADAAIGRNSISPDGTLIAIGLPTGSIDVYELENGTLRTTIPAIPKNDSVATINQMVFDPTRPRLVVGYQDAKVRVWNLAGGQLQFTHELQHGGRSYYGYAIPSLAVSPQGRFIASGGGRYDRMVCLWDAETGELLHRLEGHANRVHGLAFSHDEKRFASAGREGTLRVWDTERGREVLRLDHQRGWSYSVCFSPDDQRIAAGFSDGTLRVYGAHYPRLPRDEWVDLLPWLQEEAETADGGRDVSSLHLKSAANYGRFPIPVAPDGSYTLRGEFTRLKSGHKKTIGFLLPAGRGKTMLSFDHEDRKFAGLDQVQQLGVGDFRRAEVNPTNHPLELVDGQRYRFEVDVELLGDDAQITVQLDDEKIIDWSGPQSHLNMWPGWEVDDRRMLGVCLGEVEVEFHRLEFQLTSGDARLLEQPAPTPPPGAEVVSANQPVDLLEAVSASSIVIDGEVQQGDDGVLLTAETDMRGRLDLATLPRGAYEISGSFTRVSDEGGVRLILPTAQSRFTVVLENNHGYSGLGSIDGMGPHDEENPTGIKNGRLETGHRYEFQVRVTPGEEDVAITVQVDGQPWAQWQGPHSSLTVWPPWGIANHRSIGLGVMGGRVVFDELTLTMLDGDAWLLRPRIAETPEDDNDAAPAESNRDLRGAPPEPVPAEESP